MEGHLDAARVRIGVPDASAAFRLARTLRDLHPVAVGRGPRWEVDIEEFGGDREEIAAAVRRWLAESRLPATVVLLDGMPLRIDAHDDDTGA